jgi:hypothetical protein
MYRSGARTLLLLVVAASLAVAAVAPADPSGITRPAITFGADVPGDVQALARSTWTAFTDAFSARRNCLDDITVASAWSLPDRGTYRAKEHLATVRIPGTAANLGASLMHEFAHHLDATCPAARDLHAPFMAAQGLPPTAAWSKGATWEQIPAEQFAETVVVVVLGRSAHPRVVSRPAAIRLLRAWALGR